jgi:hypothetical protein
MKTLLSKLCLLIAYFVLKKRIVQTSDTNLSQKGHPLLVLDGIIVVAV